MQKSFFMRIGVLLFFILFFAGLLYLALRDEHRTLPPNLTPKTQPEHGVVKHKHVKK